MAKNLYEVKNYYGQVEIREVSDDAATVDRMIEGLEKAAVQLPRYYSVHRNNAYSWDLWRDADSKQRMAEILPEGKYWVVFDYQYYRGGWASGSNWYAEATYVAPPEVVVS